MVIRVFRCHDCGHRMRLLGERCGYCKAPKRIYQRIGPFLWTVVLTLGLSIILTVVFSGVVGVQGAAAPTDQQ
jgi:hypothetical protein